MKREKSPRIKPKDNQSALSLNRSTLATVPNHLLNACSHSIVHWGVWRKAMGCLTSCRISALWALWMVVFQATAFAFPPAPYHTLYGTVRDQVGQSLTAQGTELILLKNGLEIGRTPIISGLQLDQNYELNIRIDQNRSGTTLYTDKAVAAQGLYSLVVEMNGVRFYPIEVSAPLTAGKGGERVRLDLNLGEDSDGDGLPDVWEQWQLYQAGHLPDENGNWALHLITRNGDFDNDGSNNLLEYIAGTFAGDPTEKFSLEIKQKLPESVRFEFFAITGKTYSIEQSSDGQNWQHLPFSIGAPLTGRIAHTATDVGILSAFAAPATGATKELYRLSVR
jgi:hypothetical protein